VSIIESDGGMCARPVVGGAQLAQAGGDSGGMPLSVGRSRPDQTATFNGAPRCGVTHRGRGTERRSGRTGIAEKRIGDCGDTAECQTQAQTWTATCRTSRCPRKREWLPPVIAASAKRAGIQSRRPTINGTREKEASGLTTPPDRRWPPFGSSEVAKAQLPGPTRASHASGSRPTLLVGFGRRTKSLLNQFHVLEKP
jgi:hypothetical protein